MERRTILKSSAAIVPTLLVSGCLGDDSDGGGDGGDGGDTADGGDGGETDGEMETDTESSETYVIGSGIPYKPFEYRNTDGDLIGFDVEVIDNVFGKLGWEYEFQKMSFDILIQSLDNGDIDAIMSAMTITEERKEKVDYTSPYFTAYQTVVVLENSSIETLDDLEGLTIGVQKGTTGMLATERVKEEVFDGNLTIERYDLTPDSFDALINNQVDAVVTDSSSSLPYVQNSENARVLMGDGEAVEQGVEDPPDYLTLTVEDYAMAWPNGSDKIEPVSEVMEEFVGSEEYNEIYDKYLTGEPPE
jgi:polar amino acid transport system substrate-binding protein